LRLSAAAKADVAAVWTYTNARWGSDQADSYIATLRRAIADSGASPLSGQRIDERWHCRRAGRHRIFYQIHEREVVIVRVLHMSMDERRHLP